MKRTFVFLLLGMVVVGCITDPVRRARMEFNKGYLDSRSTFDTALVSIFPAYVHGLSGGYIGYALSSFKYYRFNGLILKLPYADSLATELVNHKHVAVYDSQDSNLLIVGRLGESTDERYREFEKKYPWENSQGYIPVPNFYELNYSPDVHRVDYDPLNNRLPVGYLLYVVDASPGIYIRKDWLTEGMGLPPEWKNGYSRGYAISSDTTQNIIYWLAIW